MVTKHTAAFSHWHTLCSALSLTALLLLPGRVAEPTLEARAEQTVSAPLAEETSQKPAGFPSVTVRRQQRQIALTPLHQASLVTSRKQNTPPKPTSKLLAVVTQPDIRTEDQILADSVLRALPSACRDNLKNFYVRYDDPENRGLGGKKSIFVAKRGTSELIALITHECAHVIHSNLMGNPASGLSAFRDGTTSFYNDSPIVAFFSIAWENEHVLKTGIGSKDSPSGYAVTDAFENFAEVFTLHALHPEAFAAQARGSAVLTAQRDWMLSYFPLPSLTKSGYTWTGKVPWDVTKLPFTWNIGVSE